MGNTEGYRLVRCPKCLNVLPEPANVTVYTCGGCGATLRAKIRTSSGRYVATKQVPQDSDNYSVATSVSNGVPPRNKDEASAGAALDGSGIADASNTEHDSNGASSNENGDVQLTEQNAQEVKNTDKNDHQSFEGQDADSSEEDSADLANPNATGTPLDSVKKENQAEEKSTENSETSKERENDDPECRLNTASENNICNSERSKVTVSTQDSEQKGADETEHAVNKKSYLVRVHSRSCDLGASINSLDFTCGQTSLQSKSFRASEPLQSKIMNSVDELKGDLSELFSNKPSDCKPRTGHPPRPKQDSYYMSREAGTSSAPLAVHHPASRHPGHAARLSRSGQVAPCGLPSPRYRRHGACSGCPVEQMEMRPCRYECCHSCRPPCYGSCSDEPAMHKPVLNKEVKRRPPPRHHCRPVLRGSPFVICSNCLKLVQLPTGFSLPSKGTRRLQCGSCSEVLSYSYRDPSRKMTKPQSPFGGDDEYTTDDHEEILRAAAGDRNNAVGFGQADHLVSYSEEHGLSFGVGCSSSTEDGQQQPLHVSRNSSFNTVDERMAGDGKLHRLMGYSSARELLRRSPDLFENLDGPTPGPGASTLDRKGKGVCDGSGEPDNAARKKPKARRGGGLPLHGILKKGIQGLESLKIRS